MFFILLTIAIFSIFSYTGLKKSVCSYDTNKTDKIFYIFIFIGLLIRVVCALAYYGHNTDVTDFIAWSDMLFRDGIPAFYLSDSFTDYPPGYMYILWILGFIKNTFSLSGSANVLLFKLPAIISDMVIAKMIYSLSKEKKHNRNNIPECACGRG